MTTVARLAAFVALAFPLGCNGGKKDTPAPAHNKHQAPAAEAPAAPPGAHAGHGAPVTAPPGTQPPADSATPPGFAAVEVEPARQQLLGIRTAPVAREPIEKKVRTVGIVQIDETRTTHVHVKFEGFIEDIYVNYTGRLVRKGQPLLKIYSRDLLAAQQEYLASRAAMGRIPPGAEPSVRAAAEQLVAAARDRLRLFDVPPGVLAQIERTGTAQRAITIVSPQTGTVIEKQALEGIAVSPMTPLYVIADLSRVWVLADIYERDMASASIGRRATLRLEALPGRTFEGAVTFVSPVVDQTTRTVKVRFEFPNDRGLLRPGMYATVEMAAAVGDGLVVASDAIVDTGERKIVFVARGGGTFEPRAITTGVAFDDKYEVLEGLREGEMIAVSGQFLLDSESRIRGGRAGAPKHGAH